MKTTNIILIHLMVFYSSVFVISNEIIIKRNDAKDCGDLNGIYVLSESFFGPICFFTHCYKNDVAFVKIQESNEKAKKLEKKIIDYISKNSEPAILVVTAKTYVKATRGTKKEFGYTFWVPKSAVEKNSGNVKVRYIESETAMDIKECLISSEYVPSFFEGKSESLTKYDLYDAVTEHLKSILVGIKGYSNYTPCSVVHRNLKGEYEISYLSLDEIKPLQELFPSSTKNLPEQRNVKTIVNIVLIILLIVVCLIIWRIIKNKKMSIKNKEMPFPLESQI